MFSLVKSLGDLPNVFYVLSFDRTKVTDVLDRGADPIESDFLEKIVQVQLKLPPPWRPEVLQLFLMRLNAIVGEHSPNDAERWRQASRQAVSPYIQTPRDVARFSNSFQVIWSNVKGDVDLTDMIILTTLQLFDTSVYETVFEHIDELVGATITFEDDKIFAARFECTNAKNPSAAKNALAHLFPKLAKGWSTNYGDDTLHLRKREQRRVCTEEYYRNYFLFGRDPDRLSRAEIDAVLQQKSGAHLTDLINRLASKKSRQGGSRVAAVLEQIWETVFTKPLLSDVVAAALLDMSDDLIRREDRVWEFFAMENIDRLRLILTMGLVPLAMEDRIERVRFIGSYPRGLTLVAEAANFLAAQHGLYGGNATSESERYVSREIVNELVSRTLERIRQAARDGALLGAPRPVRLIWTWARWTTRMEVKAEISEWIKSDSAVLLLAEALPQTSYRSGAGGQKEIRMFPAAVYKEVLDIVEFKERLADIATKAGTGSEAERVHSEFLAAEEAGKEYAF